jgi:hypothetical protein
MCRWKLHPESSAVLGLRGFPDYRLGQHAGRHVQRALDHRHRRQRTEQVL